MSVISYLLLISPLKVFHCFHWVLNSHSLGMSLNLTNAFIYCAMCPWGPEEGQSVQRLKCCDKHGDKDEDNSPKNVNNVHNTSSQKYKQILKVSLFKNKLSALDSQTVKSMNEVCDCLQRGRVTWNSFYALWNMVF